MPDYNTICGQCTACCKPLYIKELRKPAGKWCKHCSVGTGCKIYDSRPRSCHTYECVYLSFRERGDPVPPELRPDISHVIVDCELDGRTHNIRCDSRFPDAWQDQPVVDLIASIICQGMPVYLVRGEKRWRVRSP